LQLARRKEEKVKVVWAHTQGEPTNWWDIPEVTARWNRLISGDAGVDYCAYVANNYLAKKNSLTALSLGCGTGSKELRWAELEKFSRIDAYDLSPSRIEVAQDSAVKNGRGTLINYQVGDIQRILLSENSYDLVLAEGSLHHFTPLREILPRISSFLKPQGYFIINEYVGPSRFQWTDRQMEAINGLLAVLPASYKTLWDGRTSKKKVFRPSRLSMMLVDPSEAVESASIEPLLQEYFEVLEMKKYGGSLLHMLFNGIAHHFCSQDAEAKRWLDILFAVEDALLEKGELSSDFLVAVCRKRHAR
jgi:ubiquinone/menaquinone biosynthesis C-methylase UbiE